MPDTRAELTKRWLALEAKGWVFRSIPKLKETRYMLLWGRYQCINYKVRVTPPWDIHHEGTTLTNFEYWTRLSDERIARSESTHLI